MLDLIVNYNRPIKVNGTVYENGREAWDQNKDFEGPVEVEFNFDSKPDPQTPIRNDSKPKFGSEVKDTTIYRIRVKPYMLKEPTPDFDFHTKWNEGIPMPHRIMEGRILKETQGMYYMELHGVQELNIGVCPVCAQTLTSKISIAMGIGPKCGGHDYQTNMSKEQIDELAKKSQKMVRETHWTGWVIKKALQEMESI